MAAQLTSERIDAPIGNRLVLGGAVLYLSEWVALFLASPPGPVTGVGRAELVRAYAENADRAAVSAGWFAVCLVGRVLVVSGLAASMRERPRERPLLDLAVAAMAMGVVLEVASYAVAAAAAQVAGSGGDAALVVALNETGLWLNVMLFGPSGVALLAAGAAMLRSRLFARWLGWLAVVAGAGAAGGCVLTAVGLAGSGTGTGDVLTGVGALAMWVWMIATGVTLYRRA